MNILNHILADEKKTKDLMELFEVLNYKIVEARNEYGFDIVPTATREPKKKKRRKVRLYKSL